MVQANVVYAIKFLIRSVKKLIIEVKNSRWQEGLKKHFCHLSL